jgi:site-specific DNA-methyltransferase (adenine-specific)
LEVINIKYKEGDYIETNVIYNEDCLIGMSRIPDNSIDMILCDLPYGVTDNSWDSLIPLDKIWESFNRIIKDNGAMIFTAIQPFTSTIIISNQKMFRYELIWEKTKMAGFLNAKTQPLRNHESVLVFYKKQSTYNPQGIRQCFIRKNRGHKESDCRNYTGATPDYNQTQTGYPGSIIKVNSENGTVHPTQKPVKLFEYLIKTYTDRDQVVLDPCMGSGTSAIACQNLGRQYIGFETNNDYYKIIQERLHANCRKLSEWDAAGVRDEKELSQWAISDLM